MDGKRGFPGNKTRTADARAGWRGERDCDEEPPPLVPLRLHLLVLLDGLDGPRVALGGERVDVVHHRGHRIVQGHALRPRHHGSRPQCLEAHDCVLERGAFNARSA